MQCGVLDWILKQKKNISGKIGEVQKKGSSQEYHIAVNVLTLINVSWFVRC